MHMRTCAMPGCDNKHRARGLCSTHYNQTHQPGRHAPVATACTVCSAPIMRGAHNDRRHTCSVTCRTVLTFGAASSSSSYHWSSDAAQRARKAGATVIEIVEREYILERDGYRCYLCRDQTDPDASPFDPSSPTVDHVIPLSKGGQHIATNMRCACLGCNSAKQADLVHMPRSA